MKIHANWNAFAAVHFDAARYIPSPAYGVNRFMLDRIGSEKARATTIVQYQPNSKFPEHEHIGGEEFLVLQGTFKDQFGEFPAGTYVRNPIGSKHAPWVDDDGCTIMVKLLQMAETGEGTTSLHINTEKEKSNGTHHKFGTVLDLYKNASTGERVEMCWLKALSYFPEAVDAQGEELFVIAGTLLLGDEAFGPCGWLRIPPIGDVRRSTLRSGPEGAQVYRKTGHLSPSALAMEKIQISDDETN